MLEGETPYLGDQNACDPIPITEPTKIDILIGHPDAKVDAQVTIGDTPQVVKLLLNSEDGTGFIYDPSVPGAGGPVYAVKNGNSYTITGTVVSAQVVSKQFEIHVTCP